MLLKKNFILSLTLFIISGFSTPLQAQIISTYAGTGAAIYGGDSAAAVSAGINTPYGVAVDNAGNVYIADYGNNRIRKVDASGIITTIAGNGSGGFHGDGGPATADSVELKNPRGIAVDGSGNIYFSDYGNNRIRKIDASGIITTIAGNFDGFPTYCSDGGMADTSHVGFPWGVAVDGAGNVYFADQSNCRIREINTSGIISTIAGTGFATFGGDGGPATAAKLQYPMGVALDNAGNIYIADEGNNRIRKINSSGVISTIAGSAVLGFSGDGGPATAAKLYYPQGIAVDVVGNIYIADLNNNRIRKINTAGIMSTITGDGTAGYNGDGILATTAQINQATGVAIDTGGRIFIADNNNNRIRYIHTLLHAPYFVKGHTQFLDMCQTEIVSIDSFLSVMAADAGKTETWSLISGPSHGSVYAVYTTTSTGSVLTTTGLTYSPTLGYTGNDSFSVGVTDGTYSDTTTVYVSIIPPPVVGAITGIDSVCPGYTTALSDSIAGGVWSSATTSICTVGTGGIVTGVAPGMDSIIYTVTNLCGTVETSIAIKVRPITECPTAVNTINAGGYKMIIAPNPAMGIMTVRLLSDNNEPAHFVITNITGEKVQEFTSVTNKPIEVQLDEPSGIYFISATTSNGRQMEKITIIR